jgi:hypothetical protein
MYQLASYPSFQLPPGIGATSGNEATALGGAGASTLASVLVATGAVAGPVGAAIGAGISLVATLIASFTQGCGQTCIQTSDWANQAEALLLQNIQAYFAQPAPRSLSSQQAALANYNSIWQWLVTQCSGANLGSAGANCISDRQEGACTWQQTSTSPLLAYVQYGEPNTGACWNWYSGYYVPIANDPDVTDDSSSALSNGAADTSASAVTGSSSSLLLPVLVIGGALVLLGLVL